MRIHFDSQTGPDVPAPGQALERIHAHLQAQQALWAERLARDPAAFAQVEADIHHAFGHLADQLVASVLAQAAQQPALDQAAKKK